MARAKKPPEDCPPTVRAYYDQDPRKFAVLMEIMLGSTRQAAVAAAGLSARQNFYKWIDQDPDFARAAADADAYDEAESLKRIKGAGRQDWRALEAHLKLKYPRRYAVKAELRHTGPDGGPIEHEHRHDHVHTVDWTALSDEELDRIISEPDETGPRSIAEDLGMGETDDLDGE